MMIRNRRIAPSEPAYIIAEIGQNHNGDLNTAKALIHAAKQSGADCVKFQKRNPDICVPDRQKLKRVSTPNGDMTYLEYRRMLELSIDDYLAITNFCHLHSIDWSVSVWDTDSLSEMVRTFDLPFIKIPSAHATNTNLVKAAAEETNRIFGPLIVSTGMMDRRQLFHLYSFLWNECNIMSDAFALMHTTSCYPCKVEDLNLSLIPKMIEGCTCPIGYSGHETGLATTLAARVLGASIIERHLTLDRASWGTDQAASIEPHGFARLVRDIRNTERAMGSNVKRIVDCEKIAMEKLK
jgi:N-acetylneuraminate synthase